MILEDSYRTARQVRRQTRRHAVLHARISWRGRSIRAKTIRALKKMFFRSGWQRAGEKARGRITGGDSPDRKKVPNSSLMHLVLVTQVNSGPPATRFEKIAPAPGFVSAYSVWVLGCSKSIGEVQQSDTRQWVTFLPPNPHYMNAVCSSRKMAVEHLLMNYAKG